MLTINTNDVSPDSKQKPQELTELSEKLTKE